MAARLKIMKHCFVHSWQGICGRPTLKDEERFWRGLVCKPYKRSLYIFLQLKAQAKANMRLVDFEEEETGT